MRHAIALLQLIVPRLMQPACGVPAGSLGWVSNRLRASHARQPIRLNKIIMTSFINPSYPDHHHGADRIEALMNAARQAWRSVSGKRGVALLVGSAFAAAVVAVSYEIMDSPNESHLLVIWMTLWIALFAALAFFAGSLHAFTSGLRSCLDDWSRSLVDAHSDQRLWAIAQHDDRVMTDLQAAMSRCDAPNGEFMRSRPQPPRRQKLAVQSSGQAIDAARLLAQYF